MDNCNYMWIDLLVNLLGGALMIVIYEFVFKAIVAYLKNKNYRGKYIHCDNDFTKLGDGINDNYTEIIIKLNKPNIWLIESIDRNNKWSGEIRIDGKTHIAGYGVYTYKKSISSGMLNIFVLDDKSCISVKADDFRKDKVVSYLWIKEHDNRIKPKRT